MKTAKVTKDVKKYLISYKDTNGYTVKKKVTRQQLAVISKVINLTILR